MPDAFRAEFTGERVIPGRVEDNLFNEHFARYRFSLRLAQSLTGRFLDAGCGTGYGAAELAAANAWVLGIDVSPDAIAHARSNYGSLPNLRFAQASCTAIPARDAAFHLITAFEVIEHLGGWPDFLKEARRVLAPGGLFLVSTPNQLYYAESRKKAGPNPFHVHEFTESEFRYELQAVFPQVTMLLQNHVEGVAFSGGEAQGVEVEISQKADDPASAHFFLAVCSTDPLPPVARFVHIPDSGNVLQTRERHIELLEGEVREKNQWFEDEKIARARMEEKVRTVEAELENQNRWARQANEEADRRAQVVSELQAQLKKSNEWARLRDAEAEERGQRVIALQEEVARATAWARERDAEADERGNRIVELQNEMAESNAGYEAAIEQWRQQKEASDRWAMETERRLSAERDEARRAFAGKTTEFENAQLQIAELERQLEHLCAQATELQMRLDMIAQSRWVRLGRTIRIGPEIART